MISLAVTLRLRGYLASRSNEIASSSTEGSYSPNEVVKGSFDRGQCTPCLFSAVKLRLHESSRETSQVGRLSAPGYLPRVNVFLSFFLSFFLFLFPANVPDQK
jgi:hypothetical protein